jgi:N-glycosylase/DNA lyase
VRFDVVGQAIRFDWGLPYELGSAAFWTDQARRARPRDDFRLGATLAEEVTACLLGGHGVPSAVALAAFERLRTELDLAVCVKREDIERLLREPLVVAHRADPVRYRFPRQRADRIAVALAVLAAESPPSEALALRGWLRAIPGIGPKTASWIVRNLTGSNDIAVIDIHVHRAGLGIGCFLPGWRLPRDYGKFETAFLLLAECGHVPAAQLDATIWFELQRLGRIAGFYGIETALPQGGNVR